VDGWSTGIEPFEDSRPERSTVTDHVFVVNASGVESRRVVEIRIVEQTAPLEILQADQQWVARECRKRLVWRIAVTGRTERQHLPDSLTASREKIDELERARAEIPDAEASGQRRWMEQQAA
jgi:hypothetical protein